MLILFAAFVSAAFAAACSSAANTQLTNCTTTWTACTADENNAACDCTYARITCGNALACDEADLKVRNDRVDPEKKKKKRKNSERALTTTA